MKPKIFAFAVALVSLGIPGQASSGCLCNPDEYFYSGFGFIYPLDGVGGPANIDLTLETLASASVAGTPIFNISGYFSFTGPNFSLSGPITGPDPAGIDIELMGEPRIVVTNLLYQGAIEPEIDSIAFTVAGQYVIAIGDPPSYDTIVVFPNLYDYENSISPLFIADVALEATPLPAALPLFASGLGALGFFGWRRKRKNAVPSVRFEFAGQLRTSGNS
jgi:hypothetical protein